MSFWCLITIPKPLCSLSSTVATVECSSVIMTAEMTWIKKRFITDAAQTLTSSPTGGSKI